MLQCIEGPVSSISKPRHDVPPLIELCINHCCIHLQPCSQQESRAQLHYCSTLCCLSTLFTSVSNALKLNRLLSHPGIRWTASVGLLVRTLL